MKRIMTLLLAAGMVFGAATGASAIDFNMKGQWLFGFGYAESGLIQKQSGKKTASASGDKFQASQRLRLQLDAVASESLSGTVMFEIGDTNWGKASAGGALGADGTIVEVMRAYIDWIVPNTELKFRMGLQNLSFPSVIGGSAILDENTAGIAASWRINDNFALTGVWARPYNDNFTGSAHNASGTGHYSPANYLDNVDIFMLSLPVTLDGWKITPWVSYGFAGNNYNDSIAFRDGSVNTASSVTRSTLFNGTMPYPAPTAGAEGNNFHGRAYSSMFWAGLPIAITALDPWNFELDLNYGYSEGFGRYNVINHSNGTVKRGDTKREGWLARGLVEYKMDWGTPGLFGWYSSGDDSNVKNGSERMPTIAPCGNISSFMGDGAERGWTIDNGYNAGYDLSMSYSGTWGLGAQIANLTFMEDLSHTVRVAYWGGTNSPSMIKYMDKGANYRGGEGLYLTTNDGLVEVNVDTTYKIYENLTATLELGYIANVVDTSTWNRHFRNDASITKSDAIKAALIFNYSF